MLSEWCGALQLVASVMKSGASCYQSGVSALQLVASVMKSSASCYQSGVGPYN